MSIEPTTQIEMPRYQCHKKVWALRIAAVVDPTESGNESDGTRVLEFVETDYSAIRESREFVRKHNPQPGMYYVVYDDGYTSVSPAKAFEEGYTRL